MTLATETPRARIEEELLRATVEGETLRRHRVGLGVVALLGGAAGLVRVAFGIDEGDFAHVLVGCPVVLGIAGLALVLAARAGRKQAGVRRRAAVLEDMLADVRRET